MTPSKTPRLALALGILLTLAAAPAARAQSPPAAGGAVQDTVTPSLGELRDRIERRYQVLPLQAGVVLIPRYRTDIQSVELADASIAVNGAPVTGQELRERLGDDAADVLRLSYLDASARRVLFGIGAPPGAPGLPVDTLGAPADTTGLAVPAGDTLPAGWEDEDDEDDEYDIDIDDGESRVRIGGSVSVAEGEVVRGDVVAIGGSVRVDGTVTGDVVAVGGTVRLGEGAVVEGEVTSVGGTIQRAPGATVEGAVNEVAFGAPQFRFDRHVGGTPPFLGDFGGLIGTVIWIVILSLLVALAYLLARRPVERMELRVADSPWKAALVGLVGQILFFPVLVLLVIVLTISIIGIPLLLLVPFALVAVAIGTLFGFTAVAKHVGHSAERRFGWDHRNPYLSVLVGVGIIMLIPFFASALGVAGGPLGAIAVALMVIGIIVQYIAWTMGFGALLLTRFGTRARWGDGSAAAPAPAPGPPPEPEPVSVRGELTGPRPPDAP